MRYHRSAIIDSAILYIAWRQKKKLGIEIQGFGAYDSTHNDACAFMGHARITRSASARVCDGNDQMIVPRRCGIQS